MSDATASNDWAGARADQSSSPGGTEEWAAALDEQRAIDNTSAASAASPASFDQLRTTGAPTESAGLDSILDIPITLSVEIGKSKLNIRHLLQLNQGSVVELDRVAGEPLDVLINGTLVAHGEVVVVNEKLGIRLTDVISAQERVKKLK